MSALEKARAAKARNAERRRRQMECQGRRYKRWLVTEREAFERKQLTETLYGVDSDTYRRADKRWRATWTEIPEGPYIFE